MYNFKLCFLLKNLDEMSEEFKDSIVKKCDYPGNTSFVMCECNTYTLSIFNDFLKNRRDSESDYSIFIELVLFLITDQNNGIIKKEIYSSFLSDFDEYKVLIDGFKMKFADIRTIESHGIINELDNYDYPSKLILFYLFFVTFRFKDTLNIDEIYEHYYKNVLNKYKNKKINKNDVFVRVLNSQNLRIPLINLIENHANEKELGEIFNKDIIIKMSDSNDYKLKNAINIMSKYFDYSSFTSSEKCKIEKCKMKFVSKNFEYFDPYNTKIIKDYINILQPEIVGLIRDYLSLNHVGRFDGEFLNENNKDKFKDKVSTKITNLKDLIDRKFISKKLIIELFDNSIISLFWRFKIRNLEFDKNALLLVSKGSVREKELIGINNLLIELGLKNYVYKIKYGTKRISIFDSINYYEDDRDLINFLLNTYSEEDLKKDRDMIKFVIFNLIASNPSCKRIYSITTEENYNTMPYVAKYYKKPKKIFEVISNDILEVTELLFNSLQKKKTLDYLCATYNNLSTEPYSEKMNMIENIIINNDKLVKYKKIISERNL